MVKECQSRQDYGWAGWGVLPDHGLFSGAWCENINSCLNFRPQILQEFNCPALSHAAVSISCMAGESQVPDPFLGVHVREGNLTLLGTTQSDRCGWYYCPCLPSCPALRSLPCLLGSSWPLLLSTGRLPSTLAPQTRRRPAIHPCQRLRELGPRWLRALRPAMAIAAAPKSQTHQI